MKKLYLDIDGVLLHKKHARVPDSNVIEKLKGVKSTSFDVLKTEAICFDEDFYWLDDSPFNAELAVLKQQGCEGRCIVVDLERNCCVF